MFSGVRLLMGKLWPNQKRGGEAQGNHEVEYDMGKSQFIARRVVPLSMSPMTLPSVDTDVVARPGRFSGREERPYSSRCGHRVPVCGSHNHRPRGGDSRIGGREITTNQVRCGTGFSVSCLATDGGQIVRTRRGGRWWLPPQPMAVRGSTSWTSWTPR